MKFNKMIVLALLGAMTVQGHKLNQRSTEEPKEHAGYPAHMSGSDGYERKVPDNF